MDIFAGHEPARIDLVYANAQHPRNIFGEALYHDKAKFWAHKNLAAITLLAARILNKKTNWVFDLKDCLRTTDAQTAMGQTAIVKANPDWLEEPNRMVSPPGNGAHPRGMAIDVCVLDSDGNEINMGTPFDDMVPEAYRNCNTLSDEILENRKILEDCFMAAAKSLKQEFLPLPAEWWDFRFPASTYRHYEALSDKDLPPQMQMTNRIENGLKDFDDSHFQNLADEIISLIDKHDENL